MATEIEKKFLVTSLDWMRENPPAVEMVQGYLAGGEKSSIRIRVAGDKAYLNIKSATLGIRRLEFEYAVPVEEAREMLDKLVSGPVVEKTRYHLPVGNHEWEIDVFHGDNAGLVVAEIELTDEQESFVMPEWAGREVSGEARYYNVCLAKHPYKYWEEKN